MKKIFILTGEPSGDKLASTVISKLKQNALSFSESVFFEKDKLLSVINSKLEYDA